LPSAPIRRLHDPDDEGHPIEKTFPPGSLSLPKVSESVDTTVQS